MPTGTEFIRALEHHRAHTLARRQPQADPLSDQVVVSWIHHDNMLEGRLFRPEEVLDALVGEDGTMDRYLHPLMEEIRRYRDAIRLVWELAHGGDDAVNLESLKAIHRILTPRSKDRGGLYRQTSPVHRDYYQPICTADKVPYHLRKLFEFIRSECDEACDPVSFAAEVHHRLMFIYPFRRNPGTTARLFTNLLLLSRGYPPAIVSSHVRQEYYNALAAPDGGDLTRIFRDSVGVFLSGSGLQLVKR
jgi:Fic family protein